MSVKRPNNTARNFRIVQQEGVGDGREILVDLSGDWSRNGDPNALKLQEHLGGANHIVLRDAGITDWDSALLTQIISLSAHAKLDLKQLPEGIGRLIDLAQAVPERGGRAHAPSPSTMARIGLRAQRIWANTIKAVNFLGLVTIAFGRLFTGKAVIKGRDFMGLLQATGIQALPIVSIISLLMGLILAFIGAVQLQQFGAAIYVADLVGLALTREMAAVMIAIVVAGRTGAAFAAQLGTMQGNEEIDALATMGIPPVEFLVLPRMLALMLIMPLLYLYGVFVGLFGGYLVGITMLDLGGQAYLDRTRDTIDLYDFMIGLVKACVFGALVAFAGCHKGMEAGRSAQAVGEAATKAVVVAILYIIVTDAIFAVLLAMMGI